MSGCWPKQNRNGTPWGKRYRKRTDHGTGLSRGGLQRALDVSVELYLLERPAAEEGKAYTYLPHMRSVQAVVPSQAAGQTWTGFAPPQSNFFKVPKVWTDLTADISSAVTMLTVEYFMRHSWGWSGWDGEPRWLTIDEIAEGRRYRSPERHDVAARVRRQRRRAEVVGVQVVDGAVLPQRHALAAYGLDCERSGVAQSASPSPAQSRASARQWMR